AGNTAASEVFTAAATYTIASRGIVRATNAVTLAPVTLASGTPYHLSVQLYNQPSPNTWAPVSDPVVSDDYRFQLVDGGKTAGVVPWLNGIPLQRASAVATVPGSDTFQIQAEGVLSRLEDLDKAVLATTYRLFFDVTIAGVASGAIALQNSRT